MKFYIKTIRNNKPCNILKTYTLSYRLVICAVVIVLPTVFTLFYLLYRCCVCCCTRGKKKRHTDKRFDSCQRAVLNSVLAAFVLVNVFCAVIMLINTQYAQYSFEELPTSKTFFTCLRSSNFLILFRTSLLHKRF